MLTLPAAALDPPPEAPPSVPPSPPWPAMADVASAPAVVVALVESEAEAALAWRGRRSRGRRWGGSWGCVLVFG